MGRTPEEWWDKLLDEESSYEMWDSEFSPNPHSPWTVVSDMVGDQGPRLVPMLITKLGPESRWALEALQAIGPAAKDAVPALEKLFRERGEGGLALFRIDEGKARELGLHRNPKTRAAIAKAIAGDTSRLGKLVDELLDDSDPGVLLFALDGGRYDEGSGITSLAKRKPDAFDAANVRKHLAHPNETIRAAAMKVLGEMQLPQDAQAVLDAMIATPGSTGGMFDWVAPLPASDRLLPELAAKGSVKTYFEIVRRRRCAFQPIDVAAARPLILRGLKGEKLDRSDAVRLLEETADVECIPAVLAMASVPNPSAPFDEAYRALCAMGPSARDAVERAHAAATGEAKRGLSWLIDYYQRFPLGELTVEDGDGLFLDGNLEDATLVDHAAYGAYGRVLAQNPRNAHAAFQLAWIDRGFGSPILSSRIDRLRELGIRDELLLGELATPPLATLPGFRGGWRKPTMGEDEVALRAERAGFPSIAAKIWRDPEKAKLASEAARAHVEWVKRVAAG